MRNSLHTYDDQALSFADRLSALIESRGVSMTKVAEEIGCAQPTLSRIIAKDRVASTQIVIACANYFNVSVDFLLGTAAQSYDKLSPDVRNLIMLYGFCSAEDKEIIKMILSKTDPAKRKIPESEIVSETAKNG